MDCGVYAVVTLLKINNIKVEAIETALLSNVGELGLSMQRIIELCQLYDIVIKAYKTNKVYKVKPHIVLLKGRYIGHFMVVHKVGRIFMKLSDHKHKSIVLPKFLFKIVWDKKIMIVL